MANKAKNQPTQENPTEQLDPTLDIESKVHKSQAVQDFYVGGVKRTLKFTAATRLRLFANVEVHEIEQYIRGDFFKIQAVALLLYGKEAVNVKLEEIIERFEDDELLDEELNAIAAWAINRTLAFILAEAESVAKALKQIQPKATLLNNTLTGSQD